MDTDKAGRGYWDTLWKNSKSKNRLSPFNGGIRNYIYRKYHIFFQKFFIEHDVEGGDLLEIGCAGSIWLSYFAKYFNFNVTGIDYSETGCELSRKMLSSENIPGRIIKTDFFSAPEYLRNSFDIVISFGVVEHYTNGSEVLNTFSSFLRPAGILITFIPNLSGINGVFQRMLSKKIFDMHVPYDRRSFEKINIIPGMKILFCDYLFNSNLHVVHFGDEKPRIFHKLLTVKKTAISLLLWTFETLFPILPPNKVFSPYIICVSRKEGSNENI